jgi:hypothetical protein
MVKTLGTYHLVKKKYSASLEIIIFLQPLLCAMMEFMTISYYIVGYKYLILLKMVFYIYFCSTYPNKKHENVKGMKLNIDRGV